MVTLARYTLEEVPEFLQASKEFLLMYEAEYSLKMGLAMRLQFGNDYGENPYLGVVKDEDVVIGVVLRTPPHNVLLSQLDNDALQIIAEALYHEYETLPGVIAQKDVALNFAEIWQALTGTSYQIKMRQCTYKLTEVQPPPVVAGELRQATDADHELMFKWFMGFNDDTFDDAREEEVQAMVERYKNDDATRTLYFWEVDGEPVSMTAATRPTMNGICVTAVYTPPEKRKRGYASACVAAVTQKCLDMGFQFCTLYTDLSNPTSNHIYQEIGYKPIVDINMIKFLNPTE